MQGGSSSSNKAAERSATPYAAGLSPLISKVVLPGLNLAVRGRGSGKAAGYRQVQSMLCSLAARWYLIARVAIAPGSILALKDALSTRSMQGTTSGLRAPPRYQQAFYSAVYDSVENLLAALDKFIEQVRLRPARIGQVVSYRPSCYRTGFHTGLEGCIINQIHAGYYFRAARSTSLPTGVLLRCL